MLERNEDREIRCFGADINGSHEDTYLAKVAITSGLVVVSVGIVAVKLMK